MSAFVILTLVITAVGEVAPNKPAPKVIVGLAIELAEHSPRSGLELEWARALVSDFRGWRFCRSRDGFFHKRIGVGQ